MTEFGGDPGHEGPGEGRRRQRRRRSGRDGRRRRRSRTGPDLPEGEGATARRRRSSRREGVGDSAQRRRQGRPQERASKDRDAIVPQGDSRLGYSLLIVLLVGLAIAAYLIFRPFISAMVAGIVITSVSYPLFSFVLKRVGEKRRGIASGLTCVILILLVFLPTIGFVWGIAAQWTEERRAAARETVSAVFAKIESVEMMAPLLFDEEENRSRRTWWKLVHHELQELGLLSGDAPSEPPPRADVQEASPGFRMPPNSLTGVATWFTRTLALLLASTVGVLIQSLLMLFIMFYFFRDGPQILAAVKNAVPVDAQYQNRVVERIQNVTKGIVRGTLATAFVQGCVATVAFSFFGALSMPLFWGALVAFSALLPAVGTALVTVPLTAWLLMEEQFVAAGCMAALAVVISSLDNLLRPLLLKDDLHMHPVWILLSMLGGVGCFGALGFILGPMVVVLLRTVLALVAESSAPQALRNE